MDRKKVTIPDLYRKKAQHLPITMLTSYDFPSAQALDRAGIDIAFVGDSYGMVVLGFRQAPVALAYAVAMLLLGFHLLHGIASIFQTLGWNPPRYRGLFTRLGQALALLVVVGNVSMPLLILSGAVGGN